MKNNKLQDIKLKAGIHSISFKYSGNPILNNKCVLTNENGKIEYTTIFTKRDELKNANTYKEFNDVISEYVGKNEISDYRFIRCDFKYEYPSNYSYEDLYKINKFFISLFIPEYSSKNRYETIDLLTKESLSMAFKNDYFDVENYNSFKKYVSDVGSVLICRTNKLNKDIPDEFTNGWNLRFSKAIENFDIIQKMYNDNLVEVYNSMCDMSIKSFIDINKDSIFTKKQLIDLISRISKDKNNVISIAENYKKRYGIEYISKKELHLFIKEIQRATMEFFSL